MGLYKLSRPADQDMERMVEYGIDHFGLSRALEYQIGLKDRLSAIADHPEMYQRVDDIRPGYRRSVYQEHSIYYRISDECVVIARILRSQDPYSALR